MSDVVPIEVVSEILSRLPVEPLLRFRCVSTTWLSLIDNPVFIKMHLKSSNLNLNANLILDGNPSLYSVSFESLTSRINDLVIDAPPVELNHPLKHEDSKILILGQCNGLLLISNDAEDCCLWNPSTGKYQMLPLYEFKPPYGCGFGQYDGGLGYDETTDDYKVVRIMQSCSIDKRNSRAKTMVFSLKSNTWKKINDFPGCIYQEVGGIFVCGALYWGVCSPENEEAVSSIVSLDLKTEEYEMVALPFQLDVALTSRVNFGVLGESLCMSCNYRFDRVDIWLMSGKGESWIKLFSVENVVSWSFENVKAIMYSLDGKHVLLQKDHEQLAWYDLEKKLVKRVLLRNGPRSFNAVSCVESLVKLNGGVVGKKVDNAKDKPRLFKRRDDFLSKGFKLRL